jgi:hypothetical protein
MTDKLGFGIPALIATFIFSARPAQSAALTSGKRESVLYNIDAGFLYLSPYPGSQGKSAASTDPDSAEGSRATSDPSPTLGLRHAAFDLEWQMPRGLTFAVTLRPDAGAAEESAAIRREVDTRAGRVIEASPTVKLLDAYRLSFRAVNAETRFGIERHAVSPYRLAGEALDFGLRPRGPEKTFAFGVFVPSILATSDSARLGLTAMAIGGREERADSVRGESGGGGQSPAKRDPYWGGVAQLDYNLPDLMSAGVAFAFMEERKSGIKVKNGLYQFGIRRSIENGVNTNLTLAVEARQLRQTYELEGSAIPDQSLSSVGLTGVLGRKSGEGILFGVWTGAGDLHPQGSMARSDTSRGHQVMGGWQWMLEDALRISAHVAREWRVDHDTGGRGSGGFADGDTHKGALSRVAIEARYMLNGQI